MRVVLAFLVWLFSFWPRKDFFLRWVRWSSPSPPASGETAREEHLPSEEGQQESELSRFLSSLPEDEGWLTSVRFDGDSKVIFKFGYREFTLVPGPDLHAGYREILEAVASSKVVFREGVKVSLLGEESCKHMEAFGDALRQSDNALRKLDIECRSRSLIRFPKCVSSVVLGNDDIQDLRLEFDDESGREEKVEAAEFMATIASPSILRILKSFHFHSWKLDEEGMEQLIKPFESPHSVLEDFLFNFLTSDVQLEHISGMLATSTSLKTLCIFNSLQRVFTRGYTSLAAALCSNQSLKTLRCQLWSSVELKACWIRYCLRTTMSNAIPPSSSWSYCGETLEGKRGLKP